MSTPDAARMPYAPPATVLQVIRHFQQKGVPEKVSDTQLGQIGVKDSVLAMVRQALEFLDLIRHDGTTTDKFKQLWYSDEQGRSSLFRELVTSAYREIIEIQDPETATRSQLANAFRPYSPRSQQDRMMTLFLSLCREAGMKISQPPRQSPTQTGFKGTVSPKEQPRQKAKQPKLVAPPHTSLEAPKHAQATTSNGMVLGVTESDLAALIESGEFDEVWAALGKVARARAMRSTSTKQEEP